jgi:hypothetical protein
MNFIITFPRAVVIHTHAYAYTHRTRVHESPLYCPEPFLISLNNHFFLFTFFKDLIFAQNMPSMT